MDQRQFSKLTERKHLELFLQLHFGDRQLNPRFEDKPDLRIDIDDVTVGVELTQCFVKHVGPTGLAPNAQEALQNKIVWKARSAYQAANPQPLWVNVYFEPATTYRGNDVDTVAQALAMTVQHFLTGQPQQGVRYSLEAWQAKRLGTPWPKGISLIGVKVVPDAGSEVWGPTRGYGVPHLEASDVQEVIDAKNKRVGDYLQKCADVWLVIVFDTGSQSSHLNVEPSLLSHPFSTQFSKVFLLRSFHQELFELQGA
ncbi:MAG TPA: hypothetical protein VLA19_32360 [Herpetosiphonaceae bacterium]|nr:hypothetical protein [Herpetosiphonaceae bacterium]